MQKIRPADIPHIAAKLTDNPPEMYWVSKKLQQQILEAQETLPASTPSEALPASGLVLYETPVWEGNAVDHIVRSGGRHGDPEIRALLAEMGDDLQPKLEQMRRLLSDSGLTLGREKRSEIIGYTWRTEDTVIVINDIHYLASDRVRTDLAQSTVWLGETNTTMPPYRQDHGYRSPSSYHCLAATFLLVSSPRIATVKRSNYGSPKNWSDKLSLSHQSPRTTTVQLLDLRKPDYTHDSLSEISNQSRKISVRFPVRGHWRQQLVGPGRKYVKPVWIREHYRGDEDAPIVTTVRSIK